MMVAFGPPSEVQVSVGIEQVCGISTFGEYDVAAVGSRGSGVSTPLMPTAGAPAASASRSRIARIGQGPGKSFDA